MSNHRLADGESNVVVEVEQSPGQDGFDVRLDGSETTISVRRIGDAGFSVLVDGHSYEAEASWDETVIRVDVAGQRLEFDTDPNRASSAEGSAKSGQANVRAPMPGKVVKVLVDAGATVERGQGILLFEAMKMQNEVRSPIAGTIQELSVVEGQAVESKEQLFVVSAQ